MSTVFIGVVKNGLFQPLFPELKTKEARRLTTVSMHHAVSPESGELNLVEYDKIAIAVKGYENGTWIYGAAIVDTGEPIVTALVESVFGK